MKNSKTLAKIQTEKTATHTPVVREYNIGGKGFIVKSIFVGQKDVKASLLDIAEKKAVKEMGLKIAIM